MPVHRERYWPIVANGRSSDAVNATFATNWPDVTQGLRDADRALVLAYAPADRRNALAALFKLDEALGQVVRGARDPLLGQMRLTWWHAALSGLGDRPLPADPALAKLVTAGVAPGLVSGEALAVMVEGWEMLLEEPIDLEAFGRLRGGTLFGLAALTLGEAHELTGPAGAGWALVDLARHSSTPVLARQALEAAGPAVEIATAIRWPKRLRALGALAALARRDLERGADRLEPPGHPARMVRALLHRLTGR